MRSIKRTFKAFNESMHESITGAAQRVGASYEIKDCRTKIIVKFENEDQLEKFYDEVVK